jgi:hypothetical protein
MTNTTDNKPRTIIVEITLESHMDGTDAKCVRDLSEFIGLDVRLISLQDVIDAEIDVYDEMGNLK